MKTAMKAAVVMVALYGGGALAQDKAAQMTPSQKEAVNQVKSMAMKERQAMMDKTKAIDAQVADVQKAVKAMDSEKARALDAQVAELQKTVKSLQSQLAKAPKYFDDPLSDPLKP